MNDGSQDELRRFLGGARPAGGGAFGTDDLQGLLLQIAFAIMMVFMLAYFLFRAEASRERQEQVLEIERQRLVLAADAVRASHRARYGLAALAPDGAGAFDPALVLRDGRLVDVPALRDAFRSGLSAAAALQRRWMDRPEEIGDPAVADILRRFLAADEQGRLLLVTDLSDALRARGLAAVSDLAGSRAVAAFLSAEPAARP